MRAIGVGAAKIYRFQLLLAFGLLLPITAAHAQPMQPGEAFVTRFSGTTDGPGGQAVIDVDGTVGSIIDVRSPRQPPQGHHWIDEPQRQPLKAAEVGQVFGVALDGENPPNIYVTATPAFGLHRTADNTQWMPGMWGPGGPGAVYRLDRANGYRPSLFARITLGNRPNSGAALGNIAYDRWNRQFFVTDLETGMIHRLRATDGADLGIWDHGVQARANFIDAENGSPGQLPPIPFNPASRARIVDCPSGNFSSSPECWNIAASGRRIWGLGVSRDAKSGIVRLYYSVASSPAYGDQSWNALPDDQKRNSVWSVELSPDGNFTGAVRREFLLPDFFETAEDIARAGFSHPASDITFPTCSNRGVMLVAERGGLRNLGFSEPNPFADPHEARLLRYELDHEGVWRAVGRYDVGFRERQPEEGPPAMQANCAGGAAFGYGYDTRQWTISRTQPDQFVWTTGDALCSSAGPCNAPGIGDAPVASPSAPQAAPQQVSETEGPQQAGDLEVHGIQGIAEGAFQPLTPAAAPPGRPGQPPQGSSLNEAYMVDTDVNIDNAGNVDVERTLSNDATWIGDIAIYQLCDIPPLGFIAVAAPPPLVGIGHDPQISHSMYESHGRTSSHFRFGSHSPYISHNRWQSHYRHWSHYREGSHNREWSHERRGSIHNRYMTHLRYGSPHDRRLTHQRLGSPHDRILTHRRYGSPHNRILTHKREGSPHDRVLTHKRYGSPPGGTHQRIGSPHDRALTHQRTGTPHNRVLTHQRTGTPHERALTHKRYGTTHNLMLTHKQQGSSTEPTPVPKLHTRAMSGAGKAPPHIPVQPLVPTPPPGGQHTRAMSHARIGSPGQTHNQVQSHNRVGSPKQTHTQAQSHVRAGSPAKQQFVPKAVQHAAAASHARRGSAKAIQPPRVNQQPKLHQQPRVNQQPKVIQRQKAVQQPKARLQGAPQGAGQKKAGGQPQHTRVMTHQRTGSKKQ
jgi:hypothetical protein